MSLKQVTKDILSTAETAGKAALNDLLGTINDVGYQASKYYTSSYTKPSQQIDMPTPLGYVGSCMRRAYQPMRYYGINNPYADVNIETPSRLDVNNKIAITPNTISKTIVEDEFNGISSEFDIQG